MAELIISETSNRRNEQRSLVIRVRGLEKDQATHSMETTTIKQEPREYVEETIDIITEGGKQIKYERGTDAGYKTKQEPTKHKEYKRKSKTKQRARRKHYATRSF